MVLVGAYPASGYIPILQSTPLWFIAFYHLLHRLTSTYVGLLAKICLLPAVGVALERGGYLTFFR